MQDVSITDSASEISESEGISEQAEMQPASTPLGAGADSIHLDSMSADEQRALLEKLLAAKQQPLAQQSADLLQGQVSAAQTALQSQPEESNPEVPLSDPVPPMMMTGTNPEVYADISQDQPADQSADQSADQPVDQAANYPNEYGSRADPDNAEAPIITDLPVETSEIESESEVTPSETEPVAPLELGSDIQVAPEVSEPVSPELSEVPETPDMDSDIHEIASSIPDSPQLPIETETSQTDAPEYETGKRDNYR